MSRSSRAAKNALTLYTHPPGGNSSFQSAFFFAVQHSSAPNSQMCATVAYIRIHNVVGAHISASTQRSSMPLNYHIFTISVASTVNPCGWHADVTSHTKSVHESMCGLPPHKKKALQCVLLVYIYNKIATSLLFIIINVVFGKYHHAKRARLLYHIAENTSKMLI